MNGQGILVPVRMFRPSFCVRWVGACGLAVYSRGLGSPLIIYELSMDMFDHFPTSKRDKHVASM